MHSHHGRETANMGRWRVAGSLGGGESSSTRPDKETSKPGWGEQICKITIQCINDIYVRNAGRTRKDFVVAGMRDDGDNTRSIVDQTCNLSPDYMHSITITITIALKFFYYYYSL